MIDHLGISVRDHAKSKDFYTQAVAPLNIGIVMEVAQAESGAASDFTGFGNNPKPFFWIGEGQVAGGMHLCFTADTRAQVDAFSAAALEAGARDNGKPGVTST